MSSLVRRALGLTARQTLGRVSRIWSARDGLPALLGGRPVRDVRLRPWRDPSAGGILSWWRGAASGLRRVYVSGSEGLPQRLQKEFASRWARYCGCRYGLLLPHGTDALRLALAAIFDHDGLDYGGEVIVPNLSFIASATAPLDRRFGVAFVDVDPHTLNIDPRRVEEAIIPGKTKAIMAVHQFGQPADMTALCDIAARYGLKIIEDAAQAHGAVWETGPVGSLGAAGAFSFQSSKNLQCGEGGILTTNDAEVFERAYSLHNAGRRLGQDGRWEHLTLGWNCRPTEYQAALLLYRFRQFEAQQQARAQSFAYLYDCLSESGCLEPVRVDSRVRKHGLYMLVLRYHPEKCGNLDIDTFLEATRREGAPLYRCYTLTLAEQPAMVRLKQRRPEYVRVLPTPVADEAVRQIVYIPGSALLCSRRDMEDIVAAVRKIEHWYVAHPVPALPQ